MSDAQMANLARNLAQALIRRAYERDPESQRQVLLLHTELCAAWRNEHEETQAQTSAQISTEARHDPSAGN